MGSLSDYLIKDEENGCLLSVEKGVSA
jgi:hypothetical protein